MKRIISLITVAVMCFALCLTSFAAPNPVSANPVLSIECENVDGDGYAIMKGKLSVDEALSPIVTSRGKSTGVAINMIQVTVSLSDAVYDLAETYISANSAIVASPAGDGTGELTFLFAPTALGGYMGSIPEYLFQIDALLKDTSLTVDQVNALTDSMTFDTVIVEITSYAGEATEQYYTKYRSDGNGDYVPTYYFGTKSVTPDPEPEEEFEITKTEDAIAGTDTMKDENGADVAAAGDKVVAIFAKNVSDTELAAGSYGIVFGGVRYAGQLAVPAKTAWAIKLVGSAEQLPAGSYAYGVFAGDATVDAATPWVID